MNDNLISLANKSSCTGCGVCVDVCAKSCISMLKDGIHVYPHIDRTQCIGCKKCMSVCPSLHTLEFVDIIKQKYYACRHKNLSAVKTSTSGGVGTALAEHAIDNGFYVVGVVLTQDGVVKHAIATRKTEIQAFKGSKYVQSDSVGIYKKCLQVIKEGHKILFIGTPCQIEAMKCIVPVSLQDCLLTCSIICHGVNSPYVWSDYRDNIEKKYHSKLVNYNFRCKSHGWQKQNGSLNLRVSYELASGKKVDVPSWKNQFHCWFGQHYIMRPSCFNCQYRTEERHSDLVIGDFGNIDKVKEGLDTYNGVSVLITTTKKGENFFNSNPYLEAIPVDGKKSVAVLKGLINKKTQETQDKELQIAKAFEGEYCRNGFEYMAKKYPNPTLLTQVINKIKSLL